MLMLKITFQCVSENHLKDGVINFSCFIFMNNMYVSIWDIIKFELAHFVQISWSFHIIGPNANLMQICMLLLLLTNIIIIYELCDDHIMNSDLWSLLFQITISKKICRKLYTCTSSYTCTCVHIIWATAYQHVIIGKYNCYIQSCCVCAKSSHICIWPIFSLSGRRPISFCCGSEVCRPRLHLRRRARGVSDLKNYVITFFYILAQALNDLNENMPNFKSVDFPVWTL